jgi:hypothetical protein
VGVNHPGLERQHSVKNGWFARLGDLAPVLVRFGRTVDEIQGYQDIFLESLENVFAAPMEAFAKREFKEMRKSRKEVQRSRDEYESTMSKYLQLNAKSQQDKVDTQEVDLAQTRRRFELARFDQVSNLNQLETKKKFQLVERVCSALYAHLGFFHQCHELVAVLEPTMNQLNQQLTQARREFAQEQRLWSAKRQQLEIKLNRGMFPHRSQERRPSQTDGDPVTPTHSRPARDRLVSEDTTYSEANGIYKAGFLYKRSSNVRRDWKRRWFTMRDDKLYYQREAAKKHHGHTHSALGNVMQSVSSSSKKEVEKKKKSFLGRTSTTSSHVSSGSIGGGRDSQLSLGSSGDVAQEGDDDDAFADVTTFEPPVEVCDILLCTRYTVLTTLYSPHCRYVTSYSARCVQRETPTYASRSR